MMTTLSKQQLKRQKQKKGFGGVVKIIGDYGIGNYQDVLKDYAKEILELNPNTNKPMLECTDRIQADFNTFIKWFKNQVKNGRYKRNRLANK